VAMLAAYLAVPDLIQGKAYFPNRFAIFAVLFLLAAAGALTSTVSRLMLAGVGSTVAFYTILFLYPVNRVYAARWAEGMQAPAVAHARMGALVTEGLSDNALSYQPQQWVGAHYFRRSRLAMLNAPWMADALSWLRPTAVYPCQFLNPQDMGACLDSSSAPPPIDLLVVVRQNAGPVSPRTVRIAARCGLTKQIWATPHVDILARPEAVASKAQPPASIVNIH